MKVMVLVKATRTSEGGAMPTEEGLRAMGAFNERLVKEGIMLSGEGLLPSREGRRIQFRSGEAREVVEGPFPDPSSLVAGFWIWQVKSMDEAVEWARRCPDPMPGEEAVLELRRIAEFEDFGDALTPELQAQEDRMREVLEQREHSRD